MEFRAMMHVTPHAGFRLLRFLPAAGLAFFLGSTAGAARAAEAAQPLTTSPLASLPPGLSDAEWMRRARAIADEQSRAPLAELTPLESSAGELLYRVQVRRPLPDPVLRLAVAVPAEGVTSATFTVDTPAGARDAGSPRPATDVSVEPFGWVRNVRVERFTIPLPAGSAGAVVPPGGVLRIALKAPLGAAPAGSGWAAAESTGPLRLAVRSLVANPQDVDRFAAASPETVPGSQEKLSWSPTGKAGQQGSGSVLRIPVSEDGIYRISGADLASSGVPVTRTAPSHLHLLLEGEEQPLVLVSASGDGGRSAASIAPGDQFVFRGLENRSPFSRTNVYWLVADSTSPSLPMAEAQAPPAGAPVETPRAFRSSLTVQEDRPPVLTRNDQFLTILDYRWVWWTWSSSPAPSLPGARALTEPGQVSFDLPGLSPDETTVSARAYFYVHSWPSSGNPVKVRVRVNGGAPSDLLISSPQDEVKPFDIPAALLRPQGNTAVFEIADTGMTSAPQAAGMRPPKLDLCFDRLELEYRRGFAPGPAGLDFTSPSSETVLRSPGARRQFQYEIPGVDPSRHPFILDVTETVPLTVRSELRDGVLSFRAAEATTRSYALRYASDLPEPELQVPGVRPDLRSSSNRADYLIIAHPDFLESMKPFADAKRAAGHAVALIDIRDVYDQFAAGQQTPLAIRTLVRYAMTHWQGSASAPAASSVLLVGDCSSAYRGQFRNGVINYVPTYSVSGWTESERYASDLWFAQVCGEDLLADALVGRFSVNNVADLQAILEKQTAYARHATPGPWRNTLAYVADHSEFEGAVDRVMDESLPDAFFRTRIRMADEPWADNYYFPAEIAEAKRAKVSPSTTARIRDMFNEGALMVTYFGHGSPNVWSNERIWFGGDSENSDNLMLHNAGKYPLIINMTCNSGAIDYPMPKWNVCISEDFMRIPNAGAVACYVPSGPGITAQHEKLTLELNRSLLTERVKPLGPAVTLGSWRYLLAGNPPELVRMFILLGDPMLELDLPQAKAADETPLHDWLAGAGGEPCSPKGAPSLAGAFAQIFRQQGERYAATPVTPLGEAPLVVSRNCSADAGKGCGNVPCGDLPAWLQTTLPDRSYASHSAAAFLLDAATARASQSSFPVGNSPELTLRSWKSAETTVPQAGSRIRVSLTLENTGMQPVRQLRVELRSADAAAGGAVSTGLQDLLPGESREFEVELKPGFGVHHYEPVVTWGKAKESCRLSDLAPPVVIAAAPKSGEEAGKPAVLLDPASVTVRWTATRDGALATVRATVFNVSTYGAGDLSAGLVSARGEVIEDTVTSIPAAAPGQKTDFELRRTYRGNVPEEEMVSLRLDPHGARADYARAPAVPVRLGKAGMPDLAILESGVRLSSDKPTDGETVFFDVDVINRGTFPVEEVKVSAFDEDSSGGRPLESRVSLPAVPRRLDPGESDTVRLRWDPFRNAGPHRIRIHVSAGESPDRTPEDNDRMVPLRVLTKYDLKKGPVAILPLTAEDRQKKQIRVIARVLNRGESPAHGVRVVIYPTPDKNPKEVLGDVILDEVPAKSHRDTIVTYKLKPGEGSRLFTPTFDAFLKGSLQRAPQAEEERAPRSGEVSTTATNTVGGLLR